ncbi:MAG: galactokinase family protein, partial [Thermoprotei archaeon]
MDIIMNMLKEFEKEYKRKPQLIMSSPGRLDFLNTHQDYKGLPVVSIGINLRSYTVISKRSDNKCRIISLNLKSENVEYYDEFDLDKIDLRNGKWFGNYLRAGLKIILKSGYNINGFNAMIFSNIPIGGGLGSSAAFTVSFISAINELFNLNIVKKEIAEIAYLAEHDIMRIPCGRLDQYGSAFGGIIKIETVPPYRVEEIPFKEGVFAVLDSGIRHSTADIHPKRQEDINRGLEILLNMPDLSEKIKQNLGKKYYEPKWEKLHEKELIQYLERIPTNFRNRILFTIREHRSTELALNIMKGIIPEISTII